MTTPTVYLLHGLMQTASGNYTNQIRAWRSNAHLVAPDLPGHGRSPIDAESPYCAQVRRYVSAVLERHGPGDVVATSYLGGPAAVRCALARPDLVRSLVLTGFVPDVPDDVFAGWTRSFLTVPEHNKPLAEVYEGVHGPRWHDTVSRYAEDAIEHYRREILVDWQTLAELPMPVLLANGSHKSAERDAALRAAALGSDVRGVVIDGGGHIPGWERPEPFQAAVESFWTEVRSGVR